MMLGLNLIYKFKTSYSLSYAKKKGLVARCNAGSTMIHDFHSGEEIHRLKKPAHPSQLLFSDDERYLIVKNTLGNIYVYETNNFEVVSIFKNTKSVEMIEGKFLFNHEQNKIVDVVKTDGIEQIVAIGLKANMISPILSIPNEGIQFITCNQQIEGKSIFTIESARNETERFIFNVLVVDLKNDKIEHELIKTEFVWDKIVYIKSKEQYLIVLGNKILLVNNNFSIIENKIKLPNEIPNSVADSIHLSKSEDSVLIIYNHILYLVQIEQLVLINSVPIEYVCFAEYINNDELIFIGTWKNGFVLKK
ncbi:hypothetical protein ACFVT8_12790 [Lysinibacillus sp. NPDC058147]|uniref:hypothetical protein n=1 Tax=unclassified Lysinibacillus TaxID=2636778 RepID=UPI0036DBAA2A